jgi:hypothetical protein
MDHHNLITIDEFRQKCYPSSLLHYYLVLAYCNANNIPNGLIYEPSSNELMTYYKNKELNDNNQKIKEAKERDLMSKEEQRVKDKILFDETRKSVKLINFDDMGAIRITKSSFFK